MFPCVATERAHSRYVDFVAPQGSEMAIPEAEPKATEGMKVPRTASFRGVLMDNVFFARLKVFFGLTTHFEDLLAASQDWLIC